MTKFHGGDAFNVIPPHVTLGGTFRSFTQLGFAHLRQRILEVVTHQAAVFGCNATVDFRDDIMPAYPPTVNDVGSYEFAKLTVAR